MKNPVPPVQQAAQGFSFDFNRAKVLMCAVYLNSGYGRGRCSFKKSTPSHTAPI